MRKHRFNRRVLFLLALALCTCATNTAIAQTTAFTYQGKLTVAGTPATASYDMQFKLFDTPDVGTGTQQGATVTNPTVQATNGIFTVSLDFGIEVFDGSPRYLEIGIRPAGSADPYTMLSPRQPITSTPYAIKSLSATDALQLGGIAASEYVVTTDPRLIDERLPTAGSPNYIQNTNKTQTDANFNISGNGVIGGDLTVLGTLNANFVGNFINNGTAQQPKANFNIDGDGVAGGTLSGNVIEAATQFNLAGNRILSNPGTRNLFVGVQAGAVNSTGQDNSFFGAFAGQANAAGSANSFFGVSAGFNNLGNDNSFFGVSAGFTNTTGINNSYFGRQAGRDNATGSNNSFFGIAAGRSSTGLDNSYFGAFAGQAPSTGEANSFFGVSAGFNNTGINNSFFGRSTGFSNTTGINNSFFGRSAGFLNTTGNDNSFFGVEAGRNNSIGSNNSFFGRAAGRGSTTGNQNSYFGFEAGRDNNSGNNNVFIGYLAGSTGTSGSSNTFVGHGAGISSNGSGNSFFGAGAASGLLSGSSNSIFGAGAGGEVSGTSHNAFFGALSGFRNTFSATVGSFNTFYGSFAGYSIGSGEGNVAIGFESGLQISLGSNNTYLGRGAGKIPLEFDSNIGNNNTLIGFNSNRAVGVNNSTAIGANTFVGTSNTVVLGTASEIVFIPGSLIVTGTVSKGGGSFKIDHPLDPENKTLSHSFVESPDMMNIYNGVVTLNRKGEAIITLPDYFQALNRDFRYQLTCIGGFAPVFIAEEIKNNRFKIAGGKSNMKVSWQITGIRHDAYAEAHRIPVEEAKPASERGTYLHPEAFKQSSKNANGVLIKGNARQRFGKARR